MWIHLYEVLAVSSLPVLASGQIFRAADNTAEYNGVWIEGDPIGMGCRHSKDCQRAGARCFGGRCKCLTTHVNVNGVCLPKLQPGRSPCAHSAQCRAGWPGTECRNTMCVCARPNEAIVRTRDATVCVPPNECPLGGAGAVLRDEHSDKPVTCEVDGRTGRTDGCLGQLHMYDCIVLGSHRGFGGAQIKGYCCPNKGNTCSQSSDAGIFAQSPQRPVRSGTVKTLPWYLNDRPSAGVFNARKRWYYDHVGRKCRQFDYRGAGGNGNNFVTQLHCENYCRTTCPFGNPLYTNEQNTPGNLKESRRNKEAQFNYRQLLCDHTNSMSFGTKFGAKPSCPSDKYQCLILQPAKAMCCPINDFMCKQNGGVQFYDNNAKNGARRRLLAYDSGVPCGKRDDMVPRSNMRYYYNPRSRTCEPFPYFGCGGNFNRFETVNDCEQTCGVGTALKELSGKDPYFIMQNNATIGDIEYRPTAPVGTLPQRAGN